MERGQSLRMFWTVYGLDVFPGSVTSKHCLPLFLKPRTKNKSSGQTEGNMFITCNSLKPQSVQCNATAVDEDRTSQRLSHSVTVCETFSCVSEAAGFKTGSVSCCLFTLQLWIQHRVILDFSFFKLIEICCPGKHLEW